MTTLALNKFDEPTVFVVVESYRGNKTIIGSHFTAASALDAAITSYEKQTWLIQLAKHIKDVVPHGYDVEDVRRDMRQVKRRVKAARSAIAETTEKLLTAGEEFYIGSNVVATEERKYSVQPVIVHTDED